MLSDFRPEVLALHLDGLPAGRAAVLLRAKSPPTGASWVWTVPRTVVQVLLEGRLPITESGGGIRGPSTLRPGDVLVAMAGSWSRRRFDAPRTLISIACGPATPAIEAYALRRPGGRSGGPVAQLPCLDRAIAATAAAIDACRDEGAAALLGLALAVQLRRALRRRPVDADERLRVRALAWLADDLGPRASRRACAAALGIHPDHLTRLFRRGGRSWRGELLRLRLERARRLLGEGLPVREVARRCGWSGASHFGAVFRRSHGVPPDRWRTMMAD